MNYPANVTEPPGTIIEPRDNVLSRQGTLRIGGKMRDFAKSVVLAAVTAAVTVLVSNELEELKKRRRYAQILKPPRIIPCLTPEPVEAEHD